MRTQPDILVHIVYRRPRLVLFGPKAAKYARVKREIDRSATSETMVKAMSAFVEELLASCSSADKSLVQYVRAYMLDVQQDPESLFSLKFMILHHWTPGAPLEFHQYASFNRQTFKDRPGSIILDARNDVASSLPKMPHPPAGSAWSFPVMQFSRSHALQTPLTFLQANLCAACVLSAAQPAPLSTKSDMGRLCQV